jgi:hypothetical protein
MLSRIRVACEANMRMMLRVHWGRRSETVGGKPKTSDDYARVKQADEGERAKVGQEISLKAALAERPDADRPSDDARNERNAEVLGKRAFRIFKDASAFVQEGHARSKQQLRFCRTRAERRQSQLFHR